MHTYISLFSGAGIGCFGIKKQGFECAATVELIPKRLNIQKFNKKCSFNAGYICGDLTDSDIQNQFFNVVDFFKAERRITDIDLIVATPPCQGMSVANHNKKNELGRNSLVLESIKIVTQIKPKYFVFENVSSFMKASCTDQDGITKSIGEAIEVNLAQNFAIESKVINLKNYGSNSSRTRTLVIGVRKDIKEICPLDIFPDFHEEKKLKDVIGHLPSLNEMGEFSKNDIYHSFRPYKEHMRAWIANTKPGKSAFDNIEDFLKPHKLINGEIVLNKRKNGDKYTRQLWGKVAPCIHTRNDCLPSQNTIHPVDDRVFSIRELMLMMTIPTEFKWISDGEIPKNNASYEDKCKFRKKTEFNIRQCIGEAVPTAVFETVAKKIKKNSEFKPLSKRELYSLIEDQKLFNYKNLIDFIKKNSNNFSLNQLIRICELANSNRLETAAFYTPVNICFSMLESLPEFKKGHIKVLEPCVGVGNFLFLLAKKFSDKTITVDCVDINFESLELCKLLAKKFLPSNVKLNFIHEDFLLSTKISKNYDLVIGNPPYKKITNNKSLLQKYHNNTSNKKTNNLYSFFVERAVKHGDYVSFIVPKAFINAPEYQVTRDLVSKFKLLNIIDYNEKAFDVKIETLSFTIATSIPNKNNITKVESYLNKEIFHQNQKYITKCSFNCWLLYRDEFFDNVCKSLKFGQFKVFRDRQITKKDSEDSGLIRIIKSRNIANGEIIYLPGYDKFLNDPLPFAVSKFLNADVIVVPNLTYNPRAARLPKNCIADGSAAILYSDSEITDKDIAYFSSNEFKNFYRIARNFGTRSMNIDSVSVNFFGIKES